MNTSDYGWCGVILDDDGRAQARCWYLRLRSNDDEEYWTTTTTTKVVGMFMGEK